jgi:protein SCO1/2
MKVLYTIARLAHPELERSWVPRFKSGTLDSVVLLSDFAVVRDLQHGKRLTVKQVHTAQASTVGRLSAPALAIAVAVIGLLGGAPRGWAQMGGGPPSTAHPQGTSLVHGTRDCLLNLILTDQYGKNVSLASFKDHVVLMNFVDTGCAERCAPLLAKLAYVGKKIRRDLGKTIFFVSVSVDSELDTPERLLAFARESGSERSGWFFLAGSPAQVDRVMQPFGLAMSVVHSGYDIETRFAYLLNRRGRLTRIYDLATVRAESLAFDLFRLLPDGDTE